METIQEQLTAVQSKLNAERELGGQKDADKIAALEAQEAELTKLILEQAQQTRLQEQVEKVESIQLPLDFNDLLENNLANEMIIEVVKQFQKQAYEEHNAEVARIHTDNKERLDMLYAAQSEAARINKEEKDSLREDVEGWKEMYAQLDLVNQQMTHTAQQIVLDKEDAEAKRDNAIAQLEESERVTLQTIEQNNDLKSQIEALKQELAAKKAISVDTNDKLAELANKAKESNAVKANRGLERWSQQYGLDVTPLTVYEPAIKLDEETPSDTQQEDPHTDSEGNSESVGNTDLEQVVEQPQEVGGEIDGEGFVSIEAYNVGFRALSHHINSLNARVEALEQR